MLEWNRKDKTTDRHKLYIKPEQLVASQFDAVGQVAVMGWLMISDSLSRTLLHPSSWPERASSSINLTCHQTLIVFNTLPVWLRGKGHSAHFCVIKAPGPQNCTYEGWVWNIYERHLRTCRFRLRRRRSSPLIKCMAPANLVSENKKAVNRWACKWKNPPGMITNWIFSWNWRERRGSNSRPPAWQATVRESIFVVNPYTYNYIKTLLR